MRSTLQVWQDIWWSGRKGWKLNVRADYHNRYRLWHKSWKAWQEFITHCRRKKARDKMAHHLAHRALLVKCWSAWKDYIQSRQNKGQQIDLAVDFAHNQLKRRVWDQWLTKISFKHKLQHMDRVALQFWADGLITKTWRVWTSACLVKTEEKEKIRVASRFYDRTLLLRVWRGLKHYRSVKKLKQLRHGAAARHFSSILLKRSFDIWVTRWQRQVQLSQFDDLISYKGDVAVARRAFVNWKYYIALKHEEYENGDIAAHHYTQHLLKTCFNALRLQAIQRRLKNMRLRMAEDLQQRFQLQRVWTVWLRRCEHSEELRLYSVSRKARAHHNFQLKRKLFTIWVRYCQWRRFRKSQYGKADYHFRERALPRYFCRMMIFVDLMHSNKENNLAAEKFRREAVLAKTFYSWWSKYQLMMDVRMMERMAILHNDEVIKRRSIQFWLQRARSKLHERKLEAVADDHRYQKLLLMGITRWREFNREMKQSRSVQHSSVRHYYIYLLRKTWAAWEQFVHHRQVKWQKQARADLLYQRHLLSVVISAWKDHHKHVKVVETHSDERLQAYNLDRLRSTFETWKRNVEANKEERRNKLVAKTLFNQTLLSKCFSGWKEFSTHHAVKKWQQWQRLQEIQQKLAKGKLHRSFRAWKSFKLKSVRDKTLRNKASHHHNKTLLGKAVQAWKSYSHLCFKIKILDRQSMWIHNRRIAAAFFTKWKKRHGIAVQEKRQTVLALWYWSVTLQRKAFYGLLEYAISRKRKAVRIAKALEERRHRLLRTGVTQWMKVGFHLASERSRLAQERQLEAAHSVHQCVYRCAMHWRRVTANRVRQRGGKPRPRRAIEPKSDWPISTLPLTTHSVPSMQPSAYTMEVNRIASEGFRERPRPRKPDYLRESFDLNQVSIATNVSPRVSSMRATKQEEDDETKPRSSPPRPSYQMRNNIHPHRRNPREESIVFPSSSGDESFPGSKQARETVDSSKATLTNGQQGLAAPVSKPVQKPSIPTLMNTAQARGPEQRVVLLPPSSFTLPSRAKGVTTHPPVPDELEVLASTSTHPASTPRTSLESEKRVASSPSSATSLSSRGSEDKEDAAGEGDVDEEEEIDEEQNDEECKPDKREEAARSILLSQLKDKGNLQERIAAMKNILQEFQDVKVAYSRKKKQRDQLSAWVQEQIERLGPNHQDDELLQTEQCLHELTEEVHKISERITKTRPLVEEVAMNIRELIHKTGLG